MVLTFRAGKLAVQAAVLAASVAGLVACSREQQDWRSAEASDTVEAYGEFLKDHPNSELVKQARARFAQLSEDRAWTQAGSADTVDAYKQFLAQYPNGKWSQEARIRVENFELGTAGTASVNSPGPGGAPPAGPASGSVSTGDLAQASAQPMSPQTSVSGAQPATQLAPGEAAQLPTPGQTSPGVAGVQSPRPPTYPVSAAAPLPDAAAPPASTTVATSGSAAATGASSIASAWHSADPTSYGVQLGAFASENAATSQWQQLVERFNAQLRGLAPHVVSAETATGRLFRLQALVADEATARALCDMLRKQSQACVPVLPH